MVPPDSHRVPRVRWYSGSCPLPFTLRLRDSHSLRSVFPDRSAGFRVASGSPTTPGSLLVWALPCSLAATLGIEFSFSSSGYLDVSVPRVRSSVPILFSTGLWDMTPIGFPHSDISGSMPVCGSPELFAAYHVLHRLLAPRHPPNALHNFTFLVYGFCWQFFSFCLAFCHFPAVLHPHPGSVPGLVVPFFLFALLACVVFKEQKKVVEMSGIEPLTPCLQGRCSPS